VVEKGIYPSAETQRHGAAMIAIALTLGFRRGGRNDVEKRHI
jgi:hypothetical protein